MNRPRTKGETQEQYRENLKLEKRLLKKRLAGRWLMRFPSVSERIEAAKAAAEKTKEEEKDDAMP